MKNFIVILAFLAIAMNNMVAATLPTISATNDKSFILNLNDWANQVVEVTLIDAQGEIVFSEDIGVTAKRIRKYNLRNLPTGIYTVNLENYQKDLAFEVSVSNKIISIEEDQKISYKPFIKKSNDRIDINILSLINDVSVTMYDLTGEEIFRDKKENVKEYGKRLNIAQLPAGTYTLSIKVGDKLYNEKIRK